MERAREQKAHLHSHRTGIVQAGNYYAGHQRTDRFRLELYRQRSGSVGSRDFDRLFGVEPEGRALAKALYQPFQFTVIAARPECWKVTL